MTRRLAELAELGGVEHGRLRIGSSSSTFVANQLPKILTDLRKTYPNSEITVSAGTSEKQVDKLTHGEIDIAFVSLPVENSLIITEKLFTDEIVAIGHPSHPLAKKRTITPSTLAQQPLILGERGGNTRRMIDDFFENAGLKPNVIMELSRQEAVNEMVENNLGVGTAGAKTIASEIRRGPTGRMDHRRRERSTGSLALRGCPVAISHRSRKSLSSCVRRALPCMRRRCGQSVSARGRYYDKGKKPRGCSREAYPLS